MGTAGIVLTVFFCAAALAAAFFAVSFFRPRLYKGKAFNASVSDKAEFVTSESGTPYLIKKKIGGSISDEPFKILSVADLHIRDDDEFSLTVLSRFLDKEKPDLVVLLGDNIVNRTDTQMQDRLKEFFEKRKQYWGFVLGNHDSEKKIYEDLAALEQKGELSDSEKEKISQSGRKWMFDSLCGGKYCVVSNEENVFGAGNCAVNIRNSKGITQSLFFFDSGDYVYGVKRKAIGSEKRCYGYIRESQLEWYKNKLNDIAAENGGRTPQSMAFFHIPLPEYQDAFSAVLRKSKDAKRIYGTDYERASSSDLNAGAFEAFRNSGSTHTTVCGHDHKNDSAIIYKGVRLMYSQGLQYNGSYNRRKKAPFRRFLNRLSKKLYCFNEGVSLFMVNADGSVDIAAKYAQKENVFYGLEKYYEQAFWTRTKRK